MNSETLSLETIIKELNLLKKKNYYLMKRFKKDRNNKTNRKNN